MIGNNEVHLKRNFELILILLLTSFFPINACGSSQATEVATAKHAVEKPRLVVFVVLDQFGWWAFQRYLPYLDNGGILQRA
ncbi:MAG: hypothetical protein IPJ88_01585 [Myxococcales bacterium]|nr:MAG: hypothetical protein IPJ88_01585 [Myxococcales bacterium]